MKGSPWEFPLGGLVAFCYFKAVFKLPYKIRTLISQPITGSLLL